MNASLLSDKVSPIREFAEIMELIEELMHMGIENAERTDTKEIPKRIEGTQANVELIKQGRASGMSAVLNDGFPFTRVLDCAARIEDAARRMGDRLPVRFVSLSTEERREGIRQAVARTGIQARFVKRMTNGKFGKSLESCSNLCIGIAVVGALELVAGLVEFVVLDYWLSQELQDDKKLLVAVLISEVLLFVLGIINLVLGTISCCNG